MPVLLMALALLADYPLPPVIDGGPRLRAKPSARDMAEAYPRDALRAEIQGRVVIACHLTAEGRLTACNVAEETPSGLGFGAATLKIAPLFRWAPTYGGGKSVEGDVRFPVIWNPPSPPN
ncbi:MAG: energy transducer TonB [Caulobacterales bacterium]|nr:energy transducer TonB [Caulobacterales bacterium]